MLNVSTRRAFATAAGLAAIPPIRAGEYFEKTTYFEMNQGSDKPNELDGKRMLGRESKRVVFFSKNTGRLKVPLGGVTKLAYERAKRSRYSVGLIFAWPLLFTKTKAHFLTIQYKDAKGEVKYALFEIDKGIYRDVLAALEAGSGVKVERLDEGRVRRDTFDVDITTL